MVIETREEKKYKDFPKIGGRDRLIRAVFWQG